MQTIRRIKGDGTHYAKSVDEGGAVTAWTFGGGAEEVAAAFDDATVAKVKANYSHRPDAGLFQFLDETGRVIFEQGSAAESPLDAPPVSLGSLAEQVKEQQVEIQLLHERVETLEAK